MDLSPRRSFSPISGSKRSMTAISSTTNSAVSKRPKFSGCALRWASLSLKASKKISGPSSSTTSSPNSISHRAPQPSSIQERSIRSSAPATSPPSWTILHHIFKVVSDDAQLSKWAGGIGNDWTNVRATGARIKGTNGTTPRRHPLPQSRQRHSRSSQSGRQKKRGDVRLSRDMAPRHRRLPRAAQKHRR